MLAFKGFAKDMTARLGKGTYQFTIGKTEEESEARCSRTGFHCAEDPLDALGYYSGDSDRYCIVQADGDIHEDACGTRISCTRITPVKEISRKELALHACNFMYKHPERKWNTWVQHNKGQADNYFAIVRGKNPAAKGKMGTLLLLLQEEEGSCEIISIAALEIDGEQYKENTYYDIAGKAVCCEKRRTKKA